MTKYVSHLKNHARLTDNLTVPVTREMKSALLRLREKHDFNAVGWVRDLIAAELPALIEELDGGEPKGAA